MPRHRAELTLLATAQGQLLELDGDEQGQAETDTDQQIQRGEQLEAQGQDQALRSVV